LTPAAAKVAMAAGVKTAAIVNYEKYVTHPVAAAPAKKDAKPKAKAATKAAVHRVPAKQAFVKRASVKQAPVNQAALKPKENAAPVAAAKNAAVSHPAAPSPAAPTMPVAVSTDQKKPSAGIPKETPQN
jgi:hypothetical protein